MFTGWYFVLADVCVVVAGSSGTSTSGWQSYSPPTINDNALSFFPDLPQNKNLCLELVKILPQKLVARL